MIEWLTPELLAGSGALGLLIAGAIRLLTAESPHRAVVADLRDSLEDARQEVDQLKAEIREVRREWDQMREEVELWRSRAYAAGWRPTDT